MLTDTRLRHLKLKEKLYKINDRDGLYVAVTPAGTISFRYNYSINGRQETVTFGRYGVGGITLAEARERLNEAKKMVAGGRSPAREKARDKARIKDAETFGAWAEKCLRGYQMAESTLDMRRSVYQRELKSKCKYTHFSSTFFLRFPGFSAISRYSSCVRLLRDPCGRSLLFSNDLPPVFDTTVS